MDAHKPLPKIWTTPIVSSMQKNRLMPRPHPLQEKRGMVNLDCFLCLAGSVGMHQHCCTETNLGSNWSVKLIRRVPTIQIYIAGNGAFCIPAVGGSYDCTKAAISLEYSNSFPWPKDCVQIHQTPFPSQRVGSWHETSK